MGAAIVWLDDGGIPTWPEVVSELFAVDAGLDPGFVLSLVNTGLGAPHMIGGVLTRAGTVLCIPYNANYALEVLPDAGFRTIAVPPHNGGWEGGVLLEDGAVLGIPNSADTFLLIRPEDAGVRFVDAGLTSSGLTPPYFEGAVVTRSGLVLLAPSSELRAPSSELRAPSSGASVGVFDPRTERLTLLSTGLPAGADRFSGAVLREDGESAFIVPRGSPQAVVANASIASQLAAASGFAGGVLLPSGEALFTPVASNMFLKLNNNGSQQSVGPMSGGYFSAAWSTNGYAYGVQTENSGTTVAIIDRFGAVTEMPSGSGVFQNSHYGFVARPDGVIVGCPYTSSNIVFLTPNTRRTVSLRTMRSPWLNKW